MQSDNNRNLLGQILVLCSSLREEILLVHYKNTIKRTETWKGREGKAGQNLFHHDFYDYYSYMYFCHERENAKLEIYERSSKF